MSSFSSKALLDVLWLVIKVEEAIGRRLMAVLELRYGEGVCFWDKKTTGELPVGQFSMIFSQDEPQTLK